MKYTTVITVLFASLTLPACTPKLNTPSPTTEVSAVSDLAIPGLTRTFEPAFPGNESINFSAVYGDRMTGQHGTFARFPANFETPLHIHSHDYRAIVLKGEMTNPFDGEINPPVLGPGSFWQVKAGSPHTTACVSNTPCEFYMYGEDSFDFIPATP